MNRRPALFARSVGLVSNGLLAVAGICVLLMMIHTVADVAIRYFLPTALPATIEIVGYYYMIGAIMLGLAATEMTDSQIRVESLDLVTPPLYRRVSLLLGKLISIAFMAILAYGALLRLLNSYRVSEMTFGHHTLTLWPSRLIFLIGVLGFLVAGAWRLWRIYCHGEEADSQSGVQRAGPL